MDEGLEDGFSGSALLHLVHLRLEKRTTRCINAYVSIRQHTSAYVSIRQHASASVSIRARLAASTRVPGGCMLESGSGAYPSPPRA